MSYRLPPERLAEYKCGECGVSNVQLYRGDGSVEAIRILRCLKHRVVSFDEALALDEGGQANILMSGRHSYVANILLPETSSSEAKEWWLGLPATA
jgi:hypothetical protein